MPLRNYWKDLLGKEEMPTLSLLEDQQLLYDSLNIDQRETFQSLEPVERDSFFLIEQKNEQIEYSLKEKPLRCTTRPWKRWKSRVVKLQKNRPL